MAATASGPSGSRVGHGMCSNACLTCASRTDDSRDDLPLACPNPRPLPVQKDRAVIHGPSRGPVLVKTSAAASLKSARPPDPVEPAYAAPRGATAPASFEAILQLLSLAANASMTAFCNWESGRLAVVQRAGPRRLEKDLLLLLAYRTLLQDDVFTAPLDLDAEDIERGERVAGSEDICMGLPVRNARGEPLGVVLVRVADIESAYPRTREALFATVALIRRDLDLREQASHDHLTGLRNRRSLDQSLAAEWRRGAREQVPMSVLLLDIDHFKAYNDQYGHLAGDAALKAVAGVLTRCVKRPADLVARFGGEEFFACLPQTDEAGAMKAAESVRAGVEALDLAHVGSPLGRVTVSVGVASIPGTVVRRMEALELVKFADDAMYRAKGQGRNRVALAHRKELVRVREAATAQNVIEATRIS